MSGAYRAGHEVVVTALAGAEKEGMMKKLILALLLLALPGLCVAQNKGNGAPKYDPTTEAVFSGTFTEIQDFTCPISGTLGSHLALKQADGTTIEVYLAPVRFMKQYEITLTPGPIKIVGSKVVFQDAPAVIARQVSQGENVFTLRDEKGKPYW